MSANNMNGVNNMNGANNMNSNAGGQEDYLDKALDSVERKFGVDTNKMRGTNEKITDALRHWFEKITGKKVPAKFSN